VTAITAKTSVELIDIVSTRMLDQFGFLSKVFAIFEKCELSVDVVASSEVMKMLPIILMVGDT
jgi:aspartate kinase